MKYRPGSTAVTVVGHATRATRSRGFSLIELMIGIVISLIGSLAMLLTFAQFEVQKRRTTASNDAQENGSFAAYELERVVRTAGSGIVQGRRYRLSGCPLTATANGRPVLPLPAALPPPFAAIPQVMRAIPVLIQDGGGTAGAVRPDTLSVVAGNPAARVFPSSVQSGTTDTSLMLDNGVGIEASDASSDYLLGAPNAAGLCVLGLLGKRLNSAPPIFSVVSGDAPPNGFVGTPKVFDMGPRPTMALYGVDTAVIPNVLLRYDVLAASQASVADGIVMLKALYGVDDGAGNGSLPGSGAADDDVIDEWVQPTGPVWGFAALSSGTPQAAASIAQIKAVRIALIAQSELGERPRDYVGPDKLELFPDLGPLKVTVTVSTQFRYKVYDITVPIRNALVNRFF